jgi:hypothetical protein
MTTIEFILDAGSTPAASTIKGENMSIFILDWFKKQKTNKQENPNFDFQDGIEDALWDIKKEYDLETEEVERTVFEKRHNLNYMNECIKNKTPDK